MAAALVPYIALVVWLDSVSPSLFFQHWLALPTSAYLWAWSRRLDAAERKELWLCVAVSGTLELLLTQAWGLYHYRFGPVPLYVFPGHGLLWLFARDVMRWPAAAARERAVCRAAAGMGVAWASAGLLLRGVPDVHGALYAPICLPLLLRSDRRLAYAATFFMTSYLELWGTRLGTWHWNPVIPGLDLPAADPPSLIAGGYFIFAFTARWLAERSELAFGQVPARVDGDVGAAQLEVDVRAR